MLELRVYGKTELSEMFGTAGMQALQRKMERYGIAFEVNGRGENAVFTIKEIEDPFKIYCITELDFDGRTDFVKVRNFLHYFFNDDEFMAMPDEVKEYRMRKQGQDVSRQTIATYIAKLDSKNLIERNTNDFIYYFALKQEQRIVEREEYLRAWHEYWNDIDNGFSSVDAIRRMQKNYGGVARKQAKPEINGIYTEQIEYLNTLVAQSIEKEIERQN